MKYFIIVSIILFFNVAYSQSLLEKFNDDENALLNKLILLSLENNPQVKVYEGRVELAKENHSQAKTSWFNNLNLSYQYVPNYNSNSDNGSLPKFGLGVSVNLGNILSTPSRISQTEDEIKIAEADYKINQQYLKAETIRRYSNYKRSIELLKIRDQAVNDSESSMMLVKHRFESGETTLEEYNRALRTFTDNKERRAESEGDLIFHRASLEEIIGVSLGEVN